MVMRILYVFVALAMVTFSLKAQAASERFWIMIDDVDNVFRTGLDQLGGASLISDDKSVIILQTRSSVSYTGGHERIPDMIEFRWRPEGEKFPHLDEMMVRAQIPPECFRLLRSRSTRYVMSLAFFVQHGVPKFSLELLESGLALGARESPQVEACRGLGFSKTTPASESK